MNEQWASERVWPLEEMWNSGMSSGEIAKRLGVTRNTVMGQVNRMKRLGRENRVKAPPRAQKPRLPPKPPKEVKPPQAPKLVKLTAAKVIAAAYKRIVFDECASIPQAAFDALKSAPLQCEPAEDAPIGVGVMDLTPNTCRWPIGHPGAHGFHFCARFVDYGVVYCATHRAKAYQPRAAWMGKKSA
jgi:GcrA cell cycle regulator